MDISKNFFEAIDLVLNLPQNTCPYIKNTKQIVSTKDIVYNMNYPFTCQMDTYFVPKKEGKYPVMLYIHGGGFVAGGKQYRIAMSQWIAENGIFVVCVDYGLAPEYIYPDPIKHLVSAVNWIADHAKEYNLDLDKLFVAGDSAGGYYSSMLCAVANNKTLQTVFDVSPKIDLKAAVLICGLYDIKKTFETKAAFNMDGKVFKSFTGIDVKDYATYELKDYISPIDFIDSSFPPTFMVYAKRDLFCEGQAECLINKLNEVGVYHEEIHSNSLLSNHCYNLNWLSLDADRANKALLNFVTRFVTGEKFVSHHRKQNLNSKSKISAPHDDNEPLTNDNLATLSENTDNTTATISK